MAHEDLAFPRLMYRGEPDTLGTGQVGETKRVDTQDEYDAAKKAGWRGARHDEDHPAEVAEAEAGTDGAEPAKPAKAKGKK